MRSTNLNERRGSCYIAILAVATIVAIIGITALTEARIAFRSADGSGEVIASRLYAQSAIEMGVFWISSDASWRTNYTNDTWVAAQPIGEGSYSWKLVDVEDGDLAAEPAGLVRLFGRGSVGDAVRTYSVLLYVDDGSVAGNLLSNPGFEDGATGWESKGDCTLEVTEDQPHGGMASLRVGNRTDLTAGPRQDIARQLTQDTTYATEAWVKLANASENVRLALYLNTEAGLTPLYIASGPVGTTGWTKVSGTFKPSWSGALYQAYWKVETDFSTQEFQIDDAVVRVAGSGGSGPAVFPVMGTWQRVVE